MNFNPCVTEIIATTSFDATLQVWNILNANCISKLTCNDAVFGCDWNYNGSLLGLTTKEKLIKIFDPRKNEITHTTAGFEGSKTQRMLFMGNSDLFLATGFSKSNERQIRMFDLRNVETPIQTLAIDNQSSSHQPYYDADTSLLYLPGRGESTVKYYELVNGSFKKASEYSSSDPAKSSIFIPKRFANYNKCEMATMLKLTKNWLSYVHFYYPKKVKTINSLNFI